MAVPRMAGPICTRASALPSPSTSTSMVAARDCVLATTILPSTRTAKVHGEFACFFGLPYLAPAAAGSVFASAWTSANGPAFCCRWGMTFEAQIPSTILCGSKAELVSLPLPCADGVGRILQALRLRPANAARVSPRVGPRVSQVNLFGMAVKKHPDSEMEARDERAFAPRSLHRAGSVLEREGLQLGSVGAVDEDAVHELLFL